MTRIEEGRLAFNFGEGWWVEKWDDADFYQGKMQRLTGELDGRGEGTKAVDFVGVYDGRTLWLIEVKDFRGHRIENRHRMGDELALEVGLKARDSLAGLVGASRMDSDGARWQDVLQVLTRSGRNPLRVVMWVETDGPLNRQEKQRRHTLLRCLKQKLCWLTHQVSVMSRDDSRLPDVNVDSLPFDN